VAPKHENAFVVVEHDGDRRPRHTNDVVLEAFPVGKLDIGESDLNPSTRVHGALSVYLPAHAFVFDHDPIMADDLRPA
jgi:hypothetical protein